MKGVAEAARVATAAAASTTSEKRVVSTTTSAASGDPFNAFILRKPRFGLMADEADRAVRTVHPGLTSAFLPAGDVVLRLAGVQSSDRDREQQLGAMLPLLRQAVVPMAEGVGLCRVDGSLNVLRREVDTGGMRQSEWSTVAAKAARVVEVPTVPKVGGGGGFVVLGSAGGEAKWKKRDKGKGKEKEKEVVVESWEEAEEEAEERERERETIGIGPVEMESGGIGIDEERTGESREEV
jgi:transcriptional repressor NF-X1